MFVLWQLLKKQIKDPSLGNAFGVFGRVGGFGQQNTLSAEVALKSEVAQRKKTACPQCNGKTALLNFRDKKKKSE
jgi:hypothetical protein